jgi:hypothetical protein
MKTLDRLHPLARFCLVVLTANTFAGVIVALLARLAMSIVTWAGGYSENFAENTFTIGGMAHLVISLIVFGLPFAAMVVGLRRFVPGSCWRKLLLFGLITLVFPGLPGLTDSSFQLSWANQYVGRAAFALVYFLYGVLLGVVIERVGPPEGGRTRATPRLA